MKFSFYAIQKPFTSNLQKKNDVQRFFFCMDDPIISKVNCYMHNDNA